MLKSSFVIFLIGLRVAVAAQQLPAFYVNGRLTTIQESDSLKMTRALQVFEIIMNDTAFQRKLLDTTFVFDVAGDPMRNLTPRQIVDTLFSGREWYHTTVDHTADITWECNERESKPLFSSTIGYGLESDSLIRTYIFYVRENSVSAIAGNVAHEWSHKVGFDHRKRNHSGRDKTVPYIVGNLVKSFAAKYD